MLNFPIKKVKTNQVNQKNMKKANLGMLLEEMMKNNDGLVKEAVSKANEYQKDYNSFVTIIDNPSNDKEGKLKGIPYSIKDNFLH